MNDLKNQVKSFLISLLFFVSKFLKRKPVVLLMDRVTSAGDNSEAMYHYLKKRKDINAYYVLGKGCDDWERLHHDKNIVDSKSFRYLWLYMRANILFTSFLLILPRGGSRVKNSQYKIVWLQHGIIHEDLSNVYNKKLGHNMVTVATEDEYQDRLRPQYGYKPSEVALTGLARYDLLYNNPRKIITICLTWRFYLQRASQDEFLKSNYYSMWEDLVVAPELFELANRYGYRIQFVLHHELRPDISKVLTERKCEEINLILNKSYKDIIAETSLLVTDYSSVAFDMAYTNKPVLYYQKDVEEFFSGKHVYQRGYYDYETDGFGEVVYDKETLLKYVEQYLSSGCQMQNEYITRVENTFKYRDQKNRERIWNEVKNRYL